MHFDLIPNDAVGLFAFQNAVPLTYKDTSNPALMYEIVSKTDSEMVLRCLSPNTGHGNNYLGGIVSADRQTIFWVNDTNPLP